MKLNYYIEIINGIKSNEDLKSLLDSVPDELIVNLESRGYIKEVIGKISKEEFKEYRRNNKENKYRCFSKNYNFSAERSGTVYYKRNYILI